VRGWPAAALNTSINEGSMRDDEEEYKRLCVEYVQRFMVEPDMARKTIAERCAYLRARIENCDSISRGVLEGQELKDAVQKKFLEGFGIDLSSLDPSEEAFKVCADVLVRTVGRLADEGRSVKIEDIPPVEMRNTAGEIIIELQKRLVDLEVSLRELGVKKS
jgi:hypothetical protein